MILGHRGSPTEADENTVASFQRALAEGADGVELDVRNIGRRLILNHEPYGDGELFDDYCSRFRHAFMVVNIKAEGIEKDALAVLAKHGIRDFFLLDLTFPSMMALSGAGEKRLAVRFSEHEPLEGCLAMKGKAQWAWVDTFTSLPLDNETYKKLKGAGFNICLVCPERWGRPKDIIAYRSFLEKNGILPDAVMTARQYAEKW